MKIKTCLIVFFLCSKLFAQDYKLENRVLIPDSIVHKFIEIYEFPFGADPIEFQHDYFSYLEKKSDSFILWNMDINSYKIYAYDLKNKKITVYGNGKGRGPGEIVGRGTFPIINSEYVFMIDKDNFKVIRFKRGSPEDFKEFKINYPIQKFVEVNDGYALLNQVFPNKGAYVVLDSLFNEVETLGYYLFGDYNSMKFIGDVDAHQPKRMYLKFYPIYVDFIDKDHYKLTAYENFDYSVPLQDMKYDNNTTGNTTVNNYDHYYSYIEGDANYHSFFNTYYENYEYYYDLYTNDHRYCNSIFIDKSYGGYIVEHLNIDKNKEAFYSINGYNSYMFMLSQDYKKIAVLDMFECAKYYQVHYQNSK